MLAFPGSNKIQGFMINQSGFVYQIINREVANSLKIIKRIIYYILIKYNLTSLV